MYEATVASRPKVVDGAAPNHVSLRRAHEIYLGCEHATYPYDGNATFQNRIQGHKRTISQLRAHLIKARVTVFYYKTIIVNNSGSERINKLIRGSFQA